MNKTAFDLRLSVDEETGRVKAGYMRLREGVVAETLEIEEGIAFADYDATGLLLGIEFLGPCQVAILDRLTEKEPEPIRQFLRGASPRELVVA